MIYFDYSATTPVREEVLESFCKVSKEFIGNPNSLHKLGMESRHLMEQATKQVADLLGVGSEEVIFTSSASESNNLALIGTIEAYPMRNKRIITTKLEHSSILHTVEYLEKKGYQIDYVPIQENGKIDMEAFKELLQYDPILVSIGYVNSEVGIIQDIPTIAKLLTQYPKTIFHVDATQAIGKIPVNVENIDLLSFSAHKFFGLKGIACLIKKQKITLEPIIHGGKSQTIYRSGTPAVALIVSMAKALRFILEDLKKNQEYVLKLNRKLREELKTIKEITINSDEDCSPYILNISIKNVKPETMIHALEEYEVYVSTKTACAVDTAHSLSLASMGKNPSISDHSLRISLSYQTTEQEIEEFVQILKKCYNALNFKKEEY